jgi:hypothetical protein
MDMRPTPRLRLTDPKILLQTGFAPQKLKELFESYLDFLGSGLDTTRRPILRARNRQRDHLA